MLAIPFVNQFILFALGGLLIAAAREDIRRRIIPNRYCLAIALLYPAYVLSAASPVNWVGGLVAGTVALLFTYAMFAFRLTGGGDAKLFASVMLWAGPQLFGLFVLMTALVGGAMAIFFLIRRRRNGSVAARVPSSVALPARIGAAITVFFGNMLLARASGVGAIPSGMSGGQAGDAGNASSISQTKDTAESLPYGVAISVGGLVVAATLLMKG